MDYEFVTRYDRLSHLAQETERTGIAGFDIETTSFEPYLLDSRGRQSDIRLVSLNNDKGLYVVDLWQTGGLGPLKEALSSDKVIKIVQNGKFEQKWFLYKYDMELWPIFDTWRASVCIHNGKDMEHHLWALFERELGIVPRGKEELGGSDWGADALTQQQIDYSAEDSEHLPVLRKSLKAQLKSKGLLRTALIEFGAILPEAATELNGVPLDAAMWTGLAADNLEKAVKSRNKLIWKLPNPKAQMGLPGITPGINLDSPLQVLKSLRKLGGPLEDLEGTQEIVLSMYAAEFPIIKELLEYRTLSKRVTQFGPKYLENIDDITGRIHPGYFPFTGAGRYACLPKTTKVATDKGIVPLAEVKSGDLIQTEIGPKKILRYIDNGLKPTLVFGLSNGTTLECTKDHKVKVNGRVQKANDIVVGDSLYLSPSVGPDPDRLVELPLLPKLGGRKKAIKVPKYLDSRTAFVLGHFVVEGCICTNRARKGKRRPGSTLPSEGSEIPAALSISLGNDEKELGIFLQKEYEEIFGLRTRLKKAPYSELRGASKELATWFQSLIGRYSRDVSVPDQVLRSPIPVREAFLRGLFEEAGGSTTGYPILTTYSVSLVAGVSTLLASLGILFFVDESSSDISEPRYTVRLSPSTRDKFPVFWPKSKLDKVLPARDKEHTGVEWPDWADTKLVYDRLKVYYCSARTYDQRSSWSIPKIRKRITRDSLAYISPAMVGDSETEKFVKWAQTTQVQSVRVVSIGRGAVQEVCDIEVEDVHAFVVNGVSVENCSRPNLQQIPRLEAFRACFRAPEGRRIVVADYSNIEMRLCAEISNDKGLIKIFNSEDDDAHRATAAMLANCSKDQVTKVQRQEAKCFHLDTEVLTRSGWKKIPDLHKGEEVIQARPNDSTGEIDLEWTVPLDIIVQPNHADHLIHLKNEGVDLRVTPEHRMLIQRANGKFTTVLPDKFPSARKWHNAGRLVGVREVDERLLRLAIATQADGYFVPGSVSIRFGFKKVRKIERLKELLLPEEFICEIKRGIKYLYISKKVGIQIRELLTPTKNFPWWWLDLTKELQDVVWDELPHWDSHKAKNWNMFRYSNCKKQSIDVVQALAALSGRKTRCVVGKHKAEEDHSDVYSLSVKQKPFSRGENVSSEKLPYTGTITCLTVESSYILVRDGGVPVISSNSINFGLIFGMKAPKLVLYAMANYGVAMTLRQAREYRAKFFSKEGYHGITKWHEHVLNNVKPKGFTRTLAGRMRYLKEDAHNEYMNTPVQGCNRAESLILTSRGYQSIESLLSNGTSAERVWTGSNWAFFEILYKGEAEAADIHLDDGTVVKCDTRHKVLSPTQDGHQWVEFEDIKTGTEVATSLCVPMKFKDAPPLEGVLQSLNKLDLFYWLGIYISNGWKSDKGDFTHTFGVHEYNLATACVDFWRQLGIESKLRWIYPLPVDGVKAFPKLKVSWKNKEVTEELTSLGFPPSLSTLKRIPSFVMESSLSERLAFLQGVLVEGDRETGKIRLRRRLFRSLLEDVKLVLRTVGVESVLTGPHVTGGHTMYVLDIHRDMWGASLRSEYAAVLGSKSELETKSISRPDTVTKYGVKKVVRVERKGKVVPTYTLSVEDSTHRFDAEGVITKNSGADGLKAALRCVYFRIKKQFGSWNGDAKMCHHVHDEIMLETRDDPEVDFLARRELCAGMREGMEQFVQKVPVVVEPESGASWGEAKG